MQYNCRVGYLIQQAAEDMARMAASHNENVVTTFNGVPLTARPGQSPDQIVRAYESHFEEMAREYDARKR